MRARVTAVDKCRKSSSDMTFKRHHVGDSTICLWVIAHVNSQKTWVIAHVNSHVWVIAQWFSAALVGDSTMLFFG